ncbi:MAG: YceI family protein [Myxococcota bacterium]
MPRLDATSARCEIFTLKEGLLSRVAHDLRIAVDRFTVELSDDRQSVTASFEPQSLRVVTAVVNGKDSPGALSSSDRAKIEETLQNDVLETRRFPEIRFRSSEIRPTDRGYHLQGELKLHGVSRRLSAEVLRETTPEGREKLSFEVSLHQPDFGIKPYTAAFGTLRVQADLRVSMSATL